MRRIRCLDDVCVVTRIRCDTPHLEPTPCAVVILRPEHMHVIDYVIRLLVVAYLRVIYGRVILSEWSRTDSVTRLRICCG